MPVWKIVYIMGTLFRRLSHFPFNFYSHGGSRENRNEEMRFAQWVDEHVQVFDSTFEN